MTAGGPELAAENVGLAHDYLLVMRGAERTFAAIADLAPTAPIYTLLADARVTDARLSTHPIITSRLQRLRIRQGRFRHLLPLYPVAAARLSAESHSLVLSSSSAFAHGLRVAPDAVHVCYCHSPFRYAWFEQARARAQVPLPLRPALTAALWAIRRRDRHVASRVTRYVANSRLTQERIQRFWDCDADVVNPPVEVERFRPDEPEDYLLLVSELVAHKRIDRALSAAQRARRRVIVAGHGPELERLTGEYEGVHEFRGWVADDELERLYARALALVVPGVEEFGITAVEAQAAGRPVVGWDAGGLTETVIPGETGVLVPERDDDALAEALAETDFTRFDPARIRQNAERFSAQAFRGRMLEQIAKAQTLG